MNDYAALRYSNKNRWTAVAVLALCVVLSAALLCARLVSYSPMDNAQRIPLTRSSGITHVTRSDGPGLFRFRPGVLTAGRPFLTASPGFSAHDKDTVWTGETDVEIFSLRYDNETGETTVHSRGGDKVLAPGTGGTYEFFLENTGNVSLDYTLEMDAWFSDTEYPIPVFASVTDYDGSWLLGGAGEMVDVLRLSEVSQSGTVAAGNILPYTLNWEWPFELDDVYDTMLGNLAVEQDLSLTIVIKTTATYCENPDAPGGHPPQTGDMSRIGLYAVMMVVSMAGILALLLLRGKEESYEVR